jgi:drug/metabolite transporter (DMT)-like permease
MTQALGIFAALVALVGWGVGGYVVHRSVRRVGSRANLFFITAVGAIVLLPFVVGQLPHTIGMAANLPILAVATIFAGSSGLLTLAAFRRGKLAVVAPILTLELVLTVGIGVLLLGERLLPAQWVLMGVVYTGILLTMIRGRSGGGRIRPGVSAVLEAGAAFALVGALSLAILNVASGVAARTVGPLASTWFVRIVVATALGVGLAASGELAAALRSGGRNVRIVLAAAVLDTLAWVAYAYAVTVLPIALTIAITQSYIVLATALGVIINKERILRHQIVGIVMALASGIALAVVSE